MESKKFEHPFLRTKQQLELQTSDKQAFKINDFTANTQFEQLIKNDFSQKLKELQGFVQAKKDSEIEEHQIQFGSESTLEQYLSLLVKTEKDLSQSTFSFKSKIETKYCFHIAYHHYNQNHLPFQSIDQIFDEFCQIQYFHNIQQRFSKQLKEFIIIRNVQGLFDFQFEKNVEKLIIKSLMSLMVSLINIQKVHLIPEFNNIPIFIEVQIQDQTKEILGFQNGQIKFQSKQKHFIHFNNFLKKLNQKQSSEFSNIEIDQIQQDLLEKHVFWLTKYHKPLRFIKINDKRQEFRNHIENMINIDTIQWIQIICVKQNKENIFEQRNILSKDFKEILSIDNLNMQKRKIIINIQRNSFDEILEFKDNIKDAINVTSWCLGFDGKRRRSNNNQKYKFSHSFKKILNNSQVGNLKIFGNQNKSQFNSNLNGLQQAELGIIDQDVQDQTMILKILFEQICSEFRNQNIPTASKIWKRLSYLVKKPQINEQFPKELSKFISLDLRFIFEQINHLPSQIFSEDQSSNEELKLSLESLHYLSTRHSKEIESQCELDQSLLMIIISMKCLKQAMQRQKIQTGSTKWRQQIQAQSKQMFQSQIISIQNNGFSQIQLNQKDLIQSQNINKAIQFNQSNNSINSSQNYILESFEIDNAQSLNQSNKEEQKIIDNQIYNENQEFVNFFKENISIDFKPVTPFNIFDNQQFEQFMKLKNTFRDQEEEYLNQILEKQMRNLIYLYKRTVLNDYEHFLQNFKAELKVNKRLKQIYDVGELKSNNMVWISQQWAAVTDGHDDDQFVILKNQLEMKFEESLLNIENHLQFHKCKIGIQNISSLLQSPGEETFKLSPLWHNLYLSKNFNLLNKSLKLFFQVDFQSEILPIFLQNLLKAYFNILKSFRDLFTTQNRQINNQVEYESKLSELDKKLEQIQFGCSLCSKFITDQQQQENQIGEQAEIIVWRIWNRVVNELNIENNFKIIEEIYDDEIHGCWSLFQTNANESNQDENSNFIIDIPYESQYRLLINNAQKIVNIQVDKNKKSAFVSYF